MMRPVSVKAEHFGSCVKLSVKWRTKYLSGIVTEYLVFPDGTVSASLTCKNITPVNLPRYGLTFELTDGVDGIEYYGKGPHENYCDRKTCTSRSLPLPERRELHSRLPVPAGEREPLRCQMAQSRRREGSHGDCGRNSV